MRDLDIDGVEAALIYPTVGLLLYFFPDSGLLTAIAGVYNDWLAEFCKPYPHRLKGIGMVNLDDVAEGVRELERCARIGLSGALITVAPPEGRGYDQPEYEPLWAAAQDLRIPLSLHFGTNRYDAATPEFVFSPVCVSNVDYFVRVSLSRMIFAGVFERYPQLKVGVVEHELAWVPHFLRRMDFCYTQLPLGAVPLRFKEEMLPSDYFHRNVFVSSQEDGLGIALRNTIGVDQLMWGSDYPHTESTFPRSRQVLEEILADCTEDEKAKIA